jgi:hypothetical protein
MNGAFRRPLVFSVALALVSLLFHTTAPVRAEDIPGTISDKEFWRLMTDLSEEGGKFSLQYMSNEDSAQFVIPDLKAAAAVFAEASAERECVLERSGALRRVSRYRTGRGSLHEEFAGGHGAPRDGAPVSVE